MTNEVEVAESLLEMKKVRAELDAAGMRGATLIELTRALNIDAERILRTLNAMGRTGEVRRSSHGGITVFRLSKFLVAPAVVRAAVVPPFRPFGGLT